MPSETFLRLPEEKRNRFLAAAWEEFTTTSFANASINQIVHRAGIPRGSFYQYFTDKEELFAYLQSTLGRHFLQMFRGLLIQSGGDMFTTVLFSFDRLMGPGGPADPMLDKCIRIMQWNPGMTTQGIMSGRGLPEEMWALMDRSALRSQETEYAWMAFTLGVFALGIAIKDTMDNPESFSLCRERLGQRLEMIRCGCQIPESQQQPAL